MSLAYQDDCTDYQWYDNISVTNLQEYLKLAGSQIGLGEDGVRLRKRPKKKDFVDAMVTHIETARILEADEIKGQKVAVVPSSPTPNPQASDPSDRRSPRIGAKKLDLRQDEEEDVEEDEENPESKEMEEDKQDNENKGGTS